MLGEAGSVADRVRLEVDYATAGDEWGKAETARALRLMEDGRRNAFYGRIRGQSKIVDWAIEDAKSAT